MIKILLVEDESYIRKGLKKLLEILEADLEVVGECANVKDAVIVSKACKPDLVLLDVNLPDGNGFDFLSQVEMLDFKVIFITAYDEYALKALKAGAIDYILKPVDIEELEVAIGKAIQTKVNIKQNQIQVAKAQLNSERLVISLRDSYQVILINELVYCKSEKGYTTFFTKGDKPIIASKPLKHFIDKLPTSKFVRVHQSSIVNLDYVDSYDKSGMIILKNKQKIPVSIRKKDEFLHKLINNK